MKIRFILLVLLFLCVVGLFAAEENYLLGGNTAGTYYFKEDLSKNFNKVFDIPITITSGYAFQTLVTDKVAVLISTDRMFCYEVGSGRELWVYPKDKGIDVPITSNAISYKGKLYFSTIKLIHCLDEKTGKILWRKSIPQTISSICKVADDVLYVSVDDKSIWRINPENGEEVGAPIQFSSYASKNNMLIKDNYLVVTNFENALICVDLKKPEKKKYSFSIPATASSFKPVIFNDFIMVTSGEQVVLYNLANGKEFARRKFASPIATSALTNGKYIYVATIDCKLHTINIDKKLTEAKDTITTPNVISNFVAISDDNLIVQDSQGLIATYDLATNKIVWQFESGMYTAGGVTVKIPGLSTSDITVLQQANPMGGAMGRGGAMGARGGRFPGRTEDLELGSNLSFVMGKPSLIAQAPMGFPGRPGTMAPGMSTMPGRMGVGNTTSDGSVIVNKNVLNLKGNAYDVDLDGYFNDPYREFVPSLISFQPFYFNGNIGFFTKDGHFRLRSVNSVDKQIPYIFEYTPGSKSDTKTVSAIGDILMKIAVFDKGSGIDFTTAKIQIKDVKGKIHSVKFIYNPVKQIFFGYIRGERDGSTINPFPDGDMNCVFTVSDYAGNVLKKEFTFRVDASVSYKEQLIPGGIYLDVETGKLIDLDPLEYANTGLISASAKNNNKSNANNDNLNVSDKGVGSGVGGNTSDSLNTNDEKKNIKSDSNNSINDNIIRGGYIGEDGNYYMPDYDQDVIYNGTVSEPKRLRNNPNAEISDESMVPPAPPFY